MPNFKSEIQSKLPNATTSIFAVMSKLASEQNAINLSQGYPDFPSSPQLIESVSEAMRNGFNQYAPMPGTYELREVISDKIAKLYNTHYNPESEITITAGATQAIYTIISALIQKDDEVIIFAPAYDSYDPTVQLNGGKIIEIELKVPDFHVDWQEVKDAVSEKTKMIIINTPHNPTGTVLKREDMLALENIVKNTGIIVLSDEVYEHIIFDGEEHQSVALYPGLAERSFIVSSFGKTFHNTGWKMGYCVAPRELMAEFRKTHQFNVFSVNHPMQKALASFLRTADNYLILPEFYQSKRDFFLDAIKSSRFTKVPSKGTYFQLLGYKNISDENDYDFAVRITKELKVASIPVSAFYNSRTDHKVLRFCFAKSEETLRRGADILNRI